MDVRFDPLAEPIRCPHGGEFILLADGSAEWLYPCRACEVGTVAGSDGRVAVAA